MSAEDPKLEEPSAAPAPPPASPNAETRPAFALDRRGLIVAAAVAAAVLVLALGAYLLTSSGLLSGGDEPAYTVADYRPPQPMISASERIMAHAEPDAASPVVVMFGAGAALDINGRVSRGIGNDWYRITWNGQTAFIRQQDAMPGEEAPPAMAERPEPEEEEEEVKPPEQEDEDVFADFPEPPREAFGLGDIVWVREPSSRDFTRYYPRRALDQGQSGRVVLDCVASARGSLDCSVVEESPPGWGFGDAALRIARQSRVAPTASDGSSVAGRHVQLPLAFRAD